MPITDQQEHFIDLYFELDFNGSKAAERAGFAPGYSWQLLRKYEIREEIDRRIAERRANSKITIEKVEGLLRDIAEVEPLDIWNADGSLRPLNEIPPHARRAIKKIKCESCEHAITGIVEQKVEIELWDKKGAIELLGKYKKMFTEKVELEGKDGGPVTVMFAIKGLKD